MANTRRQKYLNASLTASKKRNEANKIQLNLDMVSLNLLCSYIMSNNANVRRAHLINLNNMMGKLDLSEYENDPDRQRRITFITRALEGELVLNIQDSDMLIKHINGGLLEGNSITEDMSFIKPLTNTEIEWLNNVITETLKYGHFYDDADKFIDVCTRLKTGEFGSKTEIVQEFEGLINETQSKFRRSKTESNSDMTFKLRDNSCDETIRDIYKQLVNPSVRLQCGMVGINDMTGGGFEAGRVYMFFGLPGEGKSATLLNLAYQIKKYNKTYKTKDPTKTPCIVLLTMENTIRETVERLFSMSCHAEEMTNYTVEEVITMLRTEGELYINDNSPIDLIIKYKADRSVDTSYLYQLTDDLEDDGYEVICLVQDYIKRIKSVDYYQDIRLELGAVVNEFKTFAALKDIPVISASQLNRDATKHIDEGRSGGKNDLVRMLGRSNIGESMLMLENVDCSFFIAPEYDKDGNKYMGIERVKIRYRSKSNLEYIYQPFEEATSIKLVEDQGLSVPVYKTTLKPEINNGYGTNVIYHSNTYAETVDRENNGSFMPGQSSLLSMNIDETNNLETALNNIEDDTEYDNLDAELGKVSFSYITPFVIVNRETTLITPFIIK